MSQLANRFSSVFRDEHRAVRDALLELIAAIRGRSVQRARDLLGEIAALTGPHFRYEEEAMYPALVEIFGRTYVEKLFLDHDRAISSAQRLVALAGKDAWGDGEVEEGIELVRTILPHVSDCDGLSIMVERLADGQVQHILDARDHSKTADLDLLTWATEARRPPALPDA